MPWLEEASRKVVGLNPAAKDFSLEILVSFLFLESVLKCVMISLACLFGRRAQKF